jgi:hypothetical protein
VSRCTSSPATLSRIRFIHPPLSIAATNTGCRGGPGDYEI